VHSSRQSVTTLRCILVFLVLIYASALYCEWRPMNLSVEATQYRQLVWQAGSGFSLSYALQKAGLIIGNAMGLLSVSLLFLRIRRGLILLILCAPILVVATLLGAPPAAYPDVEPATTTLLWCTAAALWGSTVVYVLLQGRELFERHQMEN
jgi:hypothetical protein